MDDGSHDLAESLAMLKMAFEHGTSDIVATPHASFRYKFDSRLVAERLRELQEASGGLPKVHSGCDFHLSAANINDLLDNPRKYTINGLTYLMVEFPDMQISPATEQILQRFLDLEVIPVITHPERNPILQTAPERLRDWASMGCLVQITAQSLWDRFGKDAQESSWMLLRQGLVHVIASDAHDTVHRPPRLDRAWQYIQRELGAETAWKLFIDHPASIIKGEPLSARDRASD